MKNILFFINLLFSIFAFSQNYTIHGVVTDVNNGERLIGATIFIPNTNLYAISNSYGFYSLEVPKGKNKFKVSYLGYKTYTNNLDITGDILLNINLIEDSNTLNEVLIRAKGKNDITNLEPGSHILNLDRIKKMPAVAGEVDILKWLQLLPGIQTSHEGSIYSSTNELRFSFNP